MAQLTYVACPRCLGSGFISLPTRKAPCFACGGRTEDFTTRLPLTEFFLVSGERIPGRKGTGRVTAQKALYIIREEQLRRILVSANRAIQTNHELESLTNPSPEEPEAA